MTNQILYVCTIILCVSCSGFCKYTFTPEPVSELELEFPCDPSSDLEKATPAIGAMQSLSTDENSALISPYLICTQSVSLPLMDVDYTNESFDDCEQVIGSEHFDIQVEYAPKRSRPGYVFKVTFLPKADIPFKRISQNFYFLLDRSNAILRSRYFLNKKAVSDALELLQPEDSFNILLFDNHIVQFQEHSVPASQDKVSQARNFLEEQGHGSYFASAELFTSLRKIMHKIGEGPEINTAILFSGGETYLSQENRRQTISRWMANNRGNISLFTIAAGPGNNLALLDLLCTFNKGALLYAKDPQEISKRLDYLMRTLQNPIGKQLSATAIPEDKTMTVLLQPKSVRIPDLYQHRPFVLYGSTNKLNDFTLVVQGKYYDKRFDIKKTISFPKANIGTFSLERGWMQLVVQEYYEKYFQDGNAEHLESAKQLLTPLNLPTPL